MTISQHEFDDRDYRRARPSWMPHPGLLAFIALLWALAGVVSTLPPLSP